MRLLQRGIAPPTLVQNAAKWTIEFKQWIADGKPKSDSRATRYNKKAIKKALFRDSHGKCSYCEFEVEGGSWGEIEHILPKSKVPDDVCKWENLALACSVCNNPKDDYYDPGMPLLNPYKDVPEEHLSYDREFARGLSSRGDKTVTQMMLNRSEKRNTRNRRLEKLISEVLRYQEITDETTKVYSGKSLLSIWTDPKVPHSYMCECYLRENTPELFA
ncbi:MAG: HNH endonuclease signature motif containing protein [bacterium]